MDEKNYSVLSIGIMFFVISHAAWLWEGIVTLCKFGSFVNRGFLHGFWLPVYGFSSLVLIYAFGRRNHSFWNIFIGSALICAFIEYGTAVVLEHSFHRKWWDYKNVFLNMEGRICLPVVLLFGLAGYLLVRLLAPCMDRQITRLSTAVQKCICIVLAGLLFMDFLYSVAVPNTGYGITF